MKTKTRPSLLRASILSLLGCIALLFVPRLALAEREAVVVASKKFPESALLAEVLAQLLEHRGILVERRLNMGNTALVFENLKRGNVDIYPEYSGTALQFLGLEDAPPTASVVRRTIERRLKDEGLQWGPPLGFANSYAFAVRESFARQHELDTLTDLAKLSQQVPVRFGSTHEFLARSDGWPALQSVYDIRGTPRGVEHGIAFQLLAQEQIDVTEVYTTEGLLHAQPLRLLKDDRDFFPPYDAAYLFGSRLSNEPTALLALGSLAGRFDETEMRALNHRVEVDKQAIEDVARSFLVAQALIDGALRVEAQPVVRDGFWAFLQRERSTVLRRVGEHLWLTLVAVFAAVVVGVPLGYWATRSHWVSSLVLGASGVVQTIPSLAFLVLVIPLATAASSVWAGDAMLLAALVALFAYGLLPIIRNTKEGLLQVDPTVVQAAMGMGMTRWQRLYWVRLPLAAPFMIAGVRTSLVIGTGSATLAAFIGAGGLGEAIISGLAVQNYYEVLTGALPAAGLALSLDGAFAALQRWAMPPHLRRASQHSA